MRRANLLLALLGTACGNDIPTNLLAPPLVLDNALAYVDPEGGSVVLVDPDGKAGPTEDRQVHRIYLPGPFSGALSAPSIKQSGRSALFIIDPDNEAVHVIATRKGQVNTVVAGIPFDTLDISDDGRFGIGYQPTDGGLQKSLFAFPNAIAIFDFAQDPVRVTTLLLPNLGARPLATAFAQSAAILTQQLQNDVPIAVASDVPTALVFAKDGIIPIDLANSTAGTFIRLGTNAQPMRPLEVLFSNNRGDDKVGMLNNIERAFVRGDNGQLYVLALSAMLDLTNKVRLLATLENIVTPTQWVYDIELFFTAQGEEILLAAGGHELILVNGYTGVASRFAQDIAVDSLARFVDPQSGKDLALGFCRATASERVLRLDPLALEARRSNGVETLQFAQPVHNLQIAQAAQRALVDYNSSTTFGVLSLSAQGGVLDVSLSAQRAAETLGAHGERFFFASSFQKDAQPYLAEVVLVGQLSSNSVNLPYESRAMGVVGAYVYVDHPTPGNAATFVPYQALNQSAAKTFVGIAAARLLESPNSLGDLP